MQLEKTQRKRAAKRRVILRKKKSVETATAKANALPLTETGTLKITLDDLELWQQQPLSQNIVVRPASSKQAQPYVKTKFSLSIILASTWFLLCLYLSLSWIEELARYITPIPAIFIIFSIALIPGFMYMFLLISYLLDDRSTKDINPIYPFVSILIAAYNEEASIVDTLYSIEKQDYPAPIEIILIDDGSTDKTIQLAETTGIQRLRIINAPHQGKAAALNLGLQQAKAPYIVTLDADTFLVETALTELMHKLLSSTKETVACAGSIYLKNTPQTWMTKIQSWDYFLAIAVIKRVQSFLRGTLVAQGAFSVYEKKKLLEVNGWPCVVGEDIVLTWALLDKGYEVNFAEKAFAYTNAPSSYKQFFYQRSRWARGLIEAFRQHARLLIHPRLSTFFIYWNLGFILFDFIFLFVFIPGIIAALFGYYFIAGPMTLVVIPLGVFSNFIFLKGQKKLFRSLQAPIKRNTLGFWLYVLFYSFLMNPAVIHGYCLEFSRYKKSWGTK